MGLGALWSGYGWPAMLHETDYAEFLEMGGECETCDICFAVPAVWHVRYGAFLCGCACMRRCEEDMRQHKILEWAHRYFE